MKASAHRIVTGGNAAPILTIYQDILDLVDCL